MRKLAVLTANKNSQSLTQKLRQLGNVHVFSEKEGLSAFLDAHGSDIALLESPDPNLIRHFELLYPRTYVNNTTPSVLDDLIRDNGRCESLGTLTHFEGLESYLKKAPITTFFQPIVSLSDLKTLAAECLTRSLIEPKLWAPEFLFSYAEQKSLTDQADFMCIKKAAEQVAENLDKAELFFINIRPQTISTRNFLKQFDLFLEENSHLHGRMVLEITEEPLEFDKQRMVEATRAIASQGIPLALDDFGSGISNLELLDLIRPQYVKISGYFGNLSSSDAIKIKMVEHIVAMSRNIGAKIVLENIETKEDYLAAKSLGIDWGQGYYFGHPIAGSDW